MDERTGIVNVESDDQDLGKLKTKEEDHLVSGETNDQHGENQDVNKTTVFCVVGVTAIVALAGVGFGLGYAAVQKGRNVKFSLREGLEIT